MAAFHLFPQLPAELQKEIWRYCLPHRIFELDCPMEHIVFGFDVIRVPPWLCNLRNTTHMNYYPPMITRVCRESRSVARETGGPSLFPLKDQPRDTFFYSNISIRRGAWEDRGRDAIHLNWTPTYEPEYDAHGSPLLCLAWGATKFSRGGSLTVHYFDCDYGFPKSPDPWYDSEDEISPVSPLSPERIEELGALKQLPMWLVVMKTVIIHSNNASTIAATGLFGLLGDAPIQIVKMSEEVRVRALLDLAEECEHKHEDPVTICQDFSCESVVTYKQQLREIVMRTYDDKSLAAVMHPAIMFRWCTRMCNH